MKKQCSVLYYLLLCTAVKFSKIDIPGWTGKQEFDSLKQVEYKISENLDLILFCKRNKRTLCLAAMYLCIYDTLKKHYYTEKYLHA